MYGMGEFDFPTCEGRYSEPLSQSHCANNWKNHWSTLVPRCNYIPVHVIEPEHDHDNGTLLIS